MLIERLSDDKLSKEEWKFYITDHSRGDGVKALLSQYTFSTRQSTRHKFKPVKMYEGNRPGSFGRDRISKEDIVTPDDVFAEVKERIISNIIFD
ncbi:hypothetical protein IAQ67_28685 (plasmid) [Paenibacillus peoriae]|uniref:Uncharacterized protein n=1 Tax=Paenibacillus peoriae TaxID=59893 RepID=A0A7H0YHD1_9BACL|nr:hypothetical protein [Paenibacillus peoriae]QNR70489.1 hypothetical protein IAQ67_28685 [Paenibacillus peoriae]